MVTRPNDDDQTRSSQPASTDQLSLLAASQLCWHADAACRSLERARDELVDALADATTHLASVIELVLVLGAEVHTDLAPPGEEVAP